MRLKSLLSTDVIKSGLPTSQTSINKIVTFYPVIFFEPIEKSRHLVYNKYRFYKGLLYFKKTKKKEIMQEYTYTETKIAKFIDYQVKVEKDYLDLLLLTLMMILMFQNSKAIL